MSAVSIVQESGLCPLTIGEELWVDPDASWATPGGPGYVDTDPSEE